MSKITDAVLEQYNVGGPWRNKFNAAFPDGLDVSGPAGWLALIDAGFGPALSWLYIESGFSQFRINLRGADLREADLRMANLWGADLREADLQEASLWGANLQGVNLRWADLRLADLQGADFRGAKLQGAALTKDQAQYVVSCGAIL